jgi:uncharacterized protein (TIGR03435 family)
MCSLDLVGTARNVIAGQQPRPTFEVGSVKAQKAPLQRVDELRGVMFPRVAPGGVFSASHATLMSLITFAYDVRSAQVIGVPDWAKRASFFEVTAKAAGDVPPEQMRLMVQSMLEERFKLVTHREQRELRFYALASARADGRLGPFLQPVAEGCGSATAKDAARGRFPQRPAGGGGGIIGCGNLSELAALLGMVMDSPVSDATDRTGDFVFELVSGPPKPPAADSGETPFTQALQDQLGLKLDSRRGPIDVLVIDSASPPTEN